MQANGRDSNEQMLIHSECFSADCSQKFLGPWTLSTVRDLGHCPDQPCYFPGRGTKDSVQRKDEEKEMLKGPKLMAEHLVLQSQCAGGGDE